MGSLRAVRILGDLLKYRNPDLVFLSEMLVEKNVIKDLLAKFEFYDNFAMDRIGRGGGLAAMWKRIKEIEDKGRGILSKPWSRTTTSLGAYLGTLMTLFASDKSGQHPHHQSLLEGFKATIEECGLIELNLKGGEFTWEKSKGTENWVRERLDRAFVNNYWWRKFPLWKSFKEEVTKVWKEIPEIQLLPKLKSVSSFMAKSDEEGVSLYFEERKNLEDLLIHEELYWKQRADAFWLTDGDTNSKFFHADASKRRKLNHITHLYNDQGVLVATQEDMRIVALDYFKGVFEDGGGGLDQVVDNGGRVVNEDQNMKLTEEINFVEFTTAVKQMHPDKSAALTDLARLFFSVFGI
ncbi:hypothetical protein AgCh_033077 [Apium graveolens]